LKKAKQNKETKLTVFMNDHNIIYSWTKENPYCIKHNLHLSFAEKVSGKALK